MSATCEYGFSHGERTAETGNYFRCDNESHARAATFGDPPPRPHAVRVDNTAELEETCIENPACEVCKAIVQNRFGAHSEWLRAQRAEAWAQGVRDMAASHGHSCHEPWPAPINPFKTMERAADGEVGL